MRSIAVALLLLLLVLTSACTEAPATPGTSVDTSVDAWLRDLDARTDRGDGSWEAVHAGSLAALPFTRITLERSIAAYSMIGLLEVVFTDGERATRRGGMPDWPAPIDQVFVADVPFHEYARLCWLIETLDGLPRDSQSWEVRVSHGEQLDVSWTTRDGRTVELSDYGSGGPPALHALAAAIENAARTLEWSADGASDDDG